MAALELYAAQTRAAVYQAFVLLDEQRAALSWQRSSSQGMEVPRTTPAVMSDSTGTPVERSQEWRFDSLREVLASKLNHDGQARQPVREIPALLAHEQECER